MKIVTVRVSRTVRQSKNIDIEIPEDRVLSQTDIERLEAKAVRIAQGDGWEYFNVDEREEDKPRGVFQRVV